MKRVLSILAGVSLLAGSVSARIVDTRGGKTSVRDSTSTRLDSAAVVQMARLTGDDLTVARAKARSPKPDTTKPMSLVSQRNFLARRVGILKTEKTKVEAQLASIKAKLRATRGSNQHLLATQRRLERRLADLELAVGTKESGFVVHSEVHSYQNVNLVIVESGSGLPVWKEVGTNPNGLTLMQSVRTLELDPNLKAMIADELEAPDSAEPDQLVLGDTVFVNFGGTSDLDRPKAGKFVCGFDNAATRSFAPITYGGFTYTPHHVLACNNLAVEVQSAPCPEPTVIIRTPRRIETSGPLRKVRIGPRLTPFEWNANADWWFWIRPDYEQLPDIHDRRNDQWNVYSEIGGRLPLFRSPFYLVGRVRPIERTDTNWSQSGTLGLAAELLDDRNLYLAVEGGAQVDNRESGFYGYLQTSQIDPYHAPKNYVGEWTGRFDLTGYADLGRHTVLAGNGTYNVNRNLDQFDGSAELDVHRFVFFTEGRWYHHFPEFINLGDRTVIAEDNVFQRWYGRVGYRVVHRLEIFAGASIWDLSVKNNRADAQESYWYHQWGPLIGLEWHAGDVRINGKAAYFWRDEYHSPVDREVRADLTIGYWPGVH